MTALLGEGPITGAMTAHVLEATRRVDDGGRRP